MHADVQKGNTIITPNKPVVYGTFTGALYVSLDPDKTGTYAIGEQVSNGGWTIDGITIEHLVDDINNNTLESFQVANDEVTFIYRDKLDSSISCQIATDKFERVIANISSTGQPIPPGEGQWKEKYGWPCIHDTEDGMYNFGGYEHGFIIATDGAKFFSPGRYEYWDEDKDLEFKFKEIFNDSNNLSQEKCVSPMEWRNGKCFIDTDRYDMKRIKLFLGTYIYENLFQGYTGDPGSIVGLGVYNPEHREVYEIVGTEKAEKYLSTKQIQDDYVQAHLGYPEANAESAEMSPNGRTGSFQPFINGVMYEYSPNVYIVYGLWADEHDSLGGTGEIGFPESDVGFNFNYNGFIQKFEEKICYDKSDHILCEDRTFVMDFLNGLEGILDTCILANVTITLYQNNLILDGYYEFVNNIDSVADTEENRDYYCKLYNSNYSESLFLYNWIYGDVKCFFPESIGSYQSKKNEILERISELEKENENEIYLAQLTQDSLLTQVEEADYNATEWLGYFSIDIGLLLAAPLAKLGQTVWKEIIARVSNRYAAEIISSEIERTVLLKQVKKAVQDQLAYFGTDLSEDMVDEVMSRSIVSALKDAGSKEFTKAGNPIRWDITMSGRSNIINLANGVRVETLLGRESAFATEFLSDGEEWIIKSAFKGNITDPKFYSSNVVLDQYFYATGKQSFNVSNIKLDRVLNKEAISLYLENPTLFRQNKELFLGTPIGKMTNYVIKDAGKEIDDVIIKELIPAPPDIYPPSDFIFNVEILLK
jgi:hypothetical protein